MRVSTKMTLSIAVAGTVLFGSYGIFLLRSEERDLKRAAQQEVLLLGRSIQVAVENALRDRQLADINEIMEKLETIDPSVDILVYDAEGEATSSSEGAHASVKLAHSVAEQASIKRSWVSETVQAGDAEDLVISLPLLADDGKLLGRLAVVRPLDDMRSDLAATRWGILGLVLAFIAITTVMGLFLGTIFIRRPLGRLVQAMHRVRTGDLSSGLAVEQRDEVGMVAQEFNAMVTDLADTRSQMQAQEEEKRRFLRALQQADKLITVGQLSAGLAHEIGSPLQVLNGRARDLLASAHEPERTRRYVEIIVAQTDRIAHIVEQLLHFARRSPTRMEMVDIASAVEQVVDLLQFEARRRRIDLSAKMEQELPNVLADLDQIQQLLVNLVTNAIAATPPEGKIDVVLELASTTGPNGRPIDATCLSVTDTGCGIEEGAREKIFEPFFTTHSKEGGTGLGLAIVKAIVNEHRGSIAVDSCSGLGARFSVTLPVRGGESRP